LEPQTHQNLLSWLPIVFTVLGWVLAVGRTSSKIDTLEKTVTKQGEDHTQALKDAENRSGLRMSTMEARQSKLEDLLYNKLDSVDAKLHSISSAVAETKGYMRAQQELSK
jgi:hypothetical protein